MSEIISGAYNVKQIMSIKNNCRLYFPHYNLFNYLQAACFMYGLSIYEIKKDMSIPPLDFS